ncbi:hypothetical protein [Kutzneria sp. CA-103260]|uniref:hypothetical protein n=1 Tax=Kutzneria sp. CA-103260 TaxID=2802641 RepID=UPI001BAAD09C|nr:hypothetical protein [Kutzneria sp. CA-103260]QUQ64471.1 hypothetical protein JJ691_21910 [Kutzneria sp. CA-103260]
MFIGTALRKDALADRLTTCLLQIDESTHAMNDPFPPWDTHGIDDSCEHEGAY